MEVARILLCMVLLHSSAFLDFSLFRIGFLQIFPDYYGYLVMNFWRLFPQMGLFPFIFFWNKGIGFVSFCNDME